MTPDNLYYYSAMTKVSLIVLSYHRFGNDESDYIYSRTYKQFKHDLETKDFDWITIDDGHNSLIKACKMMDLKNIRAKVFITTDLIGQPSYCTWDEIWLISRKHDIENHSHEHIDLTKLEDRFDVFSQINQANDLIKEYTGRKPRYFVSPWNAYNTDVEQAAKEAGLQILRDRTNIKNISR